MDVAAFLRRFPPFEGLDESRLLRAAHAAREARYPAATTIIQRSGSPSTALYVVIEGTIEVEVDGRVVDVMGEGDVFGEMSLVTGDEPVATVRARTDAHCLLLDREVAKDVLGTWPGAAFLSASLRDRYDRLLEVTGSEPVRTPETTVGALISRPPIVGAPSDPISEIARRMAEGHASAAVVLLPDDLAIVTDVDLRSRVLASGRDPFGPIADVATHDVVTITEDAMAAEALFRMVQGGFHHLPVISATGDVVGVLTETDVIGFGSDSPFAIRAAISAAPTRELAAAAVSRLPQAVAALVDGGVAAVHVGHVVGATIDVLTGRLLELAIEEAGPPPTEWAWLAFGSLGRREQALHTDQDHGLAYGDEGGDPDQVDTYFARLAEAVTDGLELAGLPRCKGHIMAVNPRMRTTLHGWVEAFTGWIVGEEDFFAGAASVVFDFRRVAGALDVEPTLDRVVRAARSAEGFTRRLTRHALENKPPTGLFRDFRVEGSGDHAGRFDLKHGGIMPVTDLARLHTVAAGGSAHRTLDRLRLARDTGRIDDEMYEGLDEAFRLFWQIRLDHQIACIRASRTPDDFVDPHELSPLRRQALREAFRIVARAQRGLSAGAMWDAP